MVIASLCLNWKQNRSEFCYVPKTTVWMLAVKNSHCRDSTALQFVDNYRDGC